MAVQVTNDASALKRSANAPTQTAYTLWGWFNFSSVTPARFWGPLGIYAGSDGSPTASTDYHQISSAASGSANLVLTYDTGAGSVSVALATVAANTWYFIALTCSALTAGNLKAHIRAITANTLTTVSNASTAKTFTPARTEWGRDAFTGDFISGGVHAWGSADAALSVDELLKISYFHEPHLAGIRSLNVFCPGIASVNTDALIDKSGNARNVTATVGALADSPPLLGNQLPSYYVLPSSASPDVTLALTGNAATGAVGTLAANPSQALSGNAATGAVGTLGATHAQAITGVGATAAVGSVTPSAAIALTGNAASGQVGTLAAGADADSALTGVSATGAVGTLAVSHAQALTGNSATGAVGTLAPAHDQALTGNVATGGVGSVTPSTAIALLGNAASGQAGSLSASQAGTAGLTGVSGTGGVGTLAPTAADSLTGVGAAGAVGSLATSRAHVLTGNAASGAVGTMTASIEESQSAALTGVSAIGSVGTMTPSTVQAPCDPLTLTPRNPQIALVIAAAFLDKYGRFAKSDADVYAVRLFYPDNYCSTSYDLTAAQFTALSSADKLAIRNAGSAAGLIDTEGKSNA